MNPYFSGQDGSRTRNLLLAKQLRYQIAPQAQKIKLTLLISTRTIDFRLAHTGFEPVTSGLHTACSTAEQNALSVLVDTYGIRTHDVFPARETFYQLN